jgi:outer membrane protein OmpA-like peptidoglycan-associated protein
MPEFLNHLRFWIIAALFLGVAVGFLTRGWPGRERRLRWLAWTGLAALAGLLALALGAAQAPPALYLGAALAAFIAYLLGAAFGAMTAGGDLRAHDGWALGLLPLALLWWGAAVTGAPDYLQEIEAAASLAQTNRDIPPSPAATVPSPDARIPSAATAGDSPDLDCRRALAAAMAAGPMRFQPGRVAIHGSFAQALDAAASVIRACPAGDLEVSAQGDAPGPENQSLARRRAEAVVRYLNREGLDKRQAVVADTEPTVGFEPGAIRLGVRKF